MHYDATSLPRKMQCAASDTMPAYTPTAGMVDQTDDAREGIAAHWLAGSLLSGRITHIEEWADRKAPNGVYINEEIIDAVSYYTEQLRTRPTKRRDIERDMVAGGPAFGGATIGCRPDFIADDLADYGRRIYIEDFKYGHRTVEPDMNWTLIAYACAYIQDKVIDHDTMFEFRIHQPRVTYHPLGRSRVWIVGAAHLMALRQQMFERLNAPPTTVTTGPSCYKCPAITNCPANREASAHMMDVTQAALPDALSVADMEQLMIALETADYTMKAYREALSERLSDALMRGAAGQHYRMKRGESRAEWIDGVDVGMLQLLAPGKTVTKPAPIITPKQATKFIPEAVVAALSSRKPTLTLQRFDSQKLAQSMFGNTGD